MDAKIADRLTEQFPLGEFITEGKTKKIHRVKNKSDLGILVAKDDITAGDGKKHDVIEGKAKFATRTTCNIFRLLQACGIPAAYVEQDSDTSFVAQLCTMLPYEVVVRREAHGSYLKRNPHVQKGQLFPKTLVEFYLKTSGKNWKGKPLVADDPYMRLAQHLKTIELFDPAKPIAGAEPFLVLGVGEVFTQPDEVNLFHKMGSIARTVFLILEKAWQLQDRTLVDLKVEFGIDQSGHLLLADVVDNDSWRVLENGHYIDKQVYRDGGELSEVAAKYAHVARLTDHFALPRQQVILWSGSDKDKTEPFFDGLTLRQAELVKKMVCSVHKEPIKAVQELHRLVQDVPDSVVVAYIGRSNGAGPVLSAQSTVPVITVPASVKDFPDDAWSSLRSPSAVPVMTVLEPANAMLAALQILSARNPALYAQLRLEIEKRLTNVIPL